ncbi:MAG: crossover junction endodeoxyribonuclease RuvC [Chloroflexi bacterium]|nr:crossover junction endodeoxyribonuclease RuvC [Chloroflexota bacterium]
MRILGIDPGTVKMGYGVVEEDADTAKMIECGVLTCRATSDIEERLAMLYQQLIQVIARAKPDEVAVEEPFVSDNVRAALSIGRAQAIAILAAAQKGIPVFRYSPAQVKQRVSSYGGSGKQQIQEVVRLRLGLPEAPQPDDAADALALALCHLQETQLSRLLEEDQ